MRFLITPNLPHAYDLRMVNGLAAGLRNIGHEALALTGPLSEIEARQACIAHGVDVLLEVNRARSPTVSLPAHVRHIAWFQDPIVSDVFSGVRSDDLVYAITDTPDIPINLGGKCRTGYLCLAVDEDTIAKTPGNGPSVDFCLPGFIPQPFPDAGVRLWENLLLKYGARKGSAKLQRMPRLTEAYRQIVFRHSQAGQLAHVLCRIVEQQYRPLRGELDMSGLAREMRFALTPRLDAEADDTMLMLFARDYPRMLDRIALVRGVQSVSDSIELYGPFWDAHPAFAKYYRGILDNQADLYSVYRRAEITLANNTHGLGLHSRTLECMVVGGFVFTHSSPADERPGGIKTSFEPGLHYGEYTPENLSSEAARWLRDRASRKLAGERAEQIVRAKHLWRHRAQQIVDDLSR